MNKAGRSRVRRKAEVQPATQSLSSELKEELAEFALDHTLTETREWLAGQGHELTLSSLRAVLADCRMERQLHSNGRAVDALMAELTRADPALRPQQLFEMGQCFFSAMALANQDARVWQMTQELQLKHQRLLLETEKYRDQVAERKAALERQISAAKGAAGISAETLQQIEQELKLL